MSSTTTPVRSKIPILRTTLGPSPPTSASDPNKKSSSIPSSPRQPISFRPSAVPSSMRRLQGRLPISPRTQTARVSAPDEKQTKSGYELGRNVTLKLEDIETSSREVLDTSMENGQTWQGKGDFLPGQDREYEWDNSFEPSGKGTLDDGGNFTKEEKNLGTFEKEEKEYEVSEKNGAYKDLEIEAEGRPISFDYGKKEEDGKEPAPNVSTKPSLRQLQGSSDSQIDPLGSFCTAPATLEKLRKLDQNLTTEYPSALVNSILGKQEDTQSSTSRATVDVLYPPNPLRNDSVSLVTIPISESEAMKPGSPSKKKLEMERTNSKSYLEMYYKKLEQERLADEQKSLKSLTKVNPPQEGWTQTSAHNPDQVSVGVGSFPALESFSTDSLIEETRPPSAIVCGVTTPEVEDSECESQRRNHLPEENRDWQEIPVEVAGDASMPNDSDDDSGSEVEFETVAVAPAGNPFLPLLEVKEEPMNLEVMVDSKGSKPGDEADSGDPLFEDFSEEPVPAKDVIASSGRKTKTIFSIDLPVTVTESNVRRGPGPGENGDGPDPYGTRDKLEEECCPEKEMQEIFFHGREEVRGSRSKFTPTVAAVTTMKAVGKAASSKNVPSIGADWRTDAVPKVRSASGGNIEIQPSPVPKHVEDLTWANLAGRKITASLKPPTEKPAKKQEEQENIPEEGVCQALISETSTLILKREISEGRSYTGSISILNSTSFLYAFKILCTKVAAETFSIRPKIGLIPPHTQIEVQITKKCSKMVSSYRGNYPISVKIFRSFCEDTRYLKEYFQKLSEQQPDLIQTQTIQNILFWNSGDLTGMMKLMRTVPNERMRKALMEQIHVECSNRPSRMELGPTNDAMMEEEPTLILHNVKSSMLIANQQLRQVFEEVTLVRNGMHTLIFIAVFIFGFALVMPYLITTVDNKPLTSESTLSWWESAVQSGSDLWDNLKEQVSLGWNRVVN